MSWEARLALKLSLEASRCVARFEHDGPLRLLQTLYPEGNTIAHHVLVHPPSGLVGGDTLRIEIDGASGSHGLMTTPGATRFYRSEGEPASQHTRIRLQPGARYEWLPLEAICYSGCIARNQLQLSLAPESELIGWDMTALGLPEAQLPFDRGSLLQQFELEGSWMERGLISANDPRLMNGQLGLAGHRCLATLFLATGSPLGRARRDHALDLARQVITAHPLAAWAGATAPSPRVVLVRLLAPLVEPALELLKSIRNAWRPALWDLPPTQPRTWAL